MRVEKGEDERDGIETETKKDEAEETEDSGDWRDEDKIRVYA